MPSISHLLVCCRVYYGADCCAEDSPSCCYNKHSTNTFFQLVCFWANMISFWMLVVGCEWQMQWLHVSAAVQPIPTTSTTAKPWHVKRSLSSHWLLTGVGFDTRWEWSRLISPLLHGVFFYMADSITQIKCLTPWFKRQSLASWTKMFLFTKVSISAGNMSACVARDLGFTLKRGLGQLYFLFLFYFYFSTWLLSTQHPYVSYTCLCVVLG